MISISTFIFTDTIKFNVISRFRADEVGAVMQYSSLIISWGKGGGG